MGLFKKKKKDNFIEERRRSDRVIIRTPFEYEVLFSPKITMDIEPGVMYSGETINLSSGGLLTDMADDLGTGGLLIETDKNLPEGTKIRAKLSLPMPGFSAAFVVEGFVLRNKKKGNKYEIAIAFSKIISHSFNKMRLDIVKEMFNI